MKKKISILVAQPRGFCAGVERAIDIVETALDKWGPPVYVRHEIVHNKYVVEDLKNKGAIFVQELDECPVDRPVIFSAHGVPKSVPEEAKRRNFLFVDATCPLVSKVHIETERYSNRGLQIIMIGHQGHPETIGTMGQLPPGEILLVETVEDVENLRPSNPEKLAYVTQTTLSIDDTFEISEALKRKFPSIVEPHKEDICYATTNRQTAVKELALKVDAMLIIGSSNSSNSNRLVEVGMRAGCEYVKLVENSSMVDWSAFKKVKSVGISSGASAPEILIEELISEFKNRFSATLGYLPVVKENVSFKMPRILREKTFE